MIVVMLDVVIHEMETVDDGDITVDKTDHRCRLRRDT